MLSKKQIAMLKFLCSKDKPYNLHSFTKKFHVDELDPALRQLRRERFVRIELYEEHKKTTILITETGRAKFETYRFNKFTFWIPFIVSSSISALALIIAILAYLKQ